MDPSQSPPETPARHRPDRSRPIGVGLFTDHRPLPPAPSTSAFAPDGPSLPPDGVPDPERIRSVFARALARADYAAYLHGAADCVAALGTEYSLILTGRIWSFEVRNESIPLLEIDLALALREPGTSIPVWEADFPDQEGMPLWIGLGCEPAAILSTALAEVEAAALLRFQSESFCAAWEAARRLRASGVNASESHEVVGPHSWTGTDGDGTCASASGSDEAPGPAANPGHVSAVGGPAPAFTRPETVADELR